MHFERAPRAKNQSTPVVTQLRTRSGEPQQEAPHARATVDDLGLSLGADPVQLAALDGAVQRVWDAVAARQQPDHATLQRRARDVQRHADVHAAAARGIGGTAQPLPHLAAIQRSFGRAHDLSAVQAHVGGPATTACDDMGAHGYASGAHVAFARAPSLELAAHEAAHVVQQRSGAVQLSGGVGAVGDRWEQHADAVAARVVSGRSAADLLPAGGGVATGAVQHQLVQREENMSVDDGSRVAADGQKSEDGATQSEAAKGGRADDKKSDDKKASDKSNDNGGAEKSIKVGDLTFAVKATTDGAEASVKGESKPVDLDIPVLPGVFFKTTLALNVAGKAAIKADAGYEVSLTGEAKAHFSIYGGIPKVARVYAGGEAKIVLNVLKLKVPKGGSAALDGTLFALKAVAVIGAELDAVELLKKASPDFASKIGSKTKLEWNPGGEVELAKLAIGPDGKLSLQRGADLARFEAYVRGRGASLRELAGLPPAPDPNVKLAGKTFADSIVEPTDDKPLPFPQ